MKRQIYLLLILVISGLACSQKVFADHIPIVGEWSERDFRSFAPIPFSVEKEGNALFITSFMKVEGVTVRIVSSTGAVYYEDIRTFLPFDSISLSLDELEEGEYAIEFYHTNGCLRGEF